MAARVWLYISVVKPPQLTGVKCGGETNTYCFYEAGVSSSDSAGVSSVESSGAGSAGVSSTSGVGVAGVSSGVSDSGVVGSVVSSVIIVHLLLLFF